MSSLLLLLLLLFTSNAFATANEPSSTLPVDASNQVTASFYSQLRTFLNEEDSLRCMEQGLGPLVYSGGIHATSVTMVSPAFATIAYTTSCKRVVQASAAINYTTAGCAAADTAWVIASAMTANTADNFTRVSGTDYFVDCTSTSQPLLPTDSVWLMQITTAGSAITAIADKRSASGVGGAINIMRYMDQANPLQTALTALPAGSVGGTIRVPAGVKVPVPTAVTTTAGMSRIKIVCEGEDSGFVWTGGNSATLLKFSTGANRISVEGCTWTLSAAQTSIVYVEFASGVIQEVTLRDNLFNAADTCVLANGELLNFRSENNWYFDCATYGFRGLNAGGSMIGLTFRNDHFQGTALSHVYITGGSGFHFDHVIIDGSRTSASTGVEVLSFDSFAFIGGQIEFAGSYASNGIHLGTTSLGTGNASGGVITGNRIDAGALGTGVTLNYARAVSVFGNEFQRAAYGIAVGANALQTHIGSNTFAVSVTVPYNLAAAVGTVFRTDQTNGFLLPPHTVSAVGAEVVNNGSLRGIVTEPTGAVTNWTIDEILQEAGSGSLTNLITREYSGAAAGTHAAVAAASDTGDGGWGKEMVNNGLVYYALSTKPGTRSGRVTLDGATPTTVSFATAEANTTYKVLLSCAGVTATSVGYTNKQTTAFDIITVGAHDVECSWWVIP